MCAQLGSLLRLGADVLPRMAQLVPNLLRAAVDHLREFRETAGHPMM
jgi:hypothetical protein